jgi:hypothetical protein
MDGSQTRSVDNTIIVGSQACAVEPSSTPLPQTVSIGGWVDSAYPNDTVASVIYNLRTGERFDFQRNAAEFFRSPTPPYNALRALYQKPPRQAERDLPGKVGV